ncbi:hypothetical protein D3C72_1571240 [compost metagenome]
MRAAPSKSISPSASPISKCSRGWWFQVGLAPMTGVTTLPASSEPTGTSSSGMFGRRDRASFSAASTWRLSSSSAGIEFLSSATSALSCSASSLFFCAMAAPISFDAALRRDCMSCSD